VCASAFLCVSCHTEQCSVDRSQISGMSKAVEDRAYTVNVIVLLVMEPYFNYHVPFSLFHTIKRAY
jgi:hypothetical protein